MPRVEQVTTDPHLDRLFELYVEACVVDGSEPDLFELCGGDPSLLDALEKKVEAYRQVEGTLQSMLRLTPGRRVAGYAIVGELGRGGMGLVYEGRELASGESVAIKLLASSLSGDASSKARMAREARVLRDVRHPAIVAFRDLVEIDGMHLLVMDLVRGRPVRELLPDKGFSSDRVIEMGVTLAGALATIHAAGVVHRDIKLSNLMIDDRDQLKLVDLGLARDGESSLESLTATGATVGSIGSQAPEQLLGDRTDARSDLFSFGVVLFELATGVPPFRGETLAAVIDSVITCAPAFESLGFEGPLAELAAHCLQKEAAARPASAADVETRLLSLRPGAGLRGGHD